MPYFSNIYYTYNFKWFWSPDICIQNSEIRFWINSIRRGNCGKNPKSLGSILFQMRFFVLLFNQYLLNIENHGTRLIFAALSFLKRCESTQTIFSKPTHFFVTLITRSYSLSASCSSRICIGGRIPYIHSYYKNVILHYNVYLLL